MRSEGISIPGRRSTWVGLLLGALLNIGPVYKLANFLTAVRYVVHGDSMQPNFPRNEYVLVSRLAYLRGRPARGDVVVVRHPRQRHRNYIKRIVGLPGDHVRVQGGRVYIGGGLLQEPYLKLAGLDRGNHNPGRRQGCDPGTGDAPDGPFGDWFPGDDQYFVMGDNREHSDDSRSFGPLDRELIVGRAWIRYWPRTAWGFIR